VQDEGHYLRRLCLSCQNETPHRCNISKTKDLVLIVFSSIEKKTENLIYKTNCRKNSYHKSSSISQVPNKFKSHGITIYQFFNLIFLNVVIR